jgi:CRP-like cAMP-binding protein
LRAAAARRRDAFRREVACANCPVRALTAYTETVRQRPGALDIARLRQIQRKRGQLVVVQGQPAGAVYTIRSGWALRYRTLAKGRRQVLSILLPGDTVGLEAPTGSAYDFSIRALTDLALCEFERKTFLTVALASTESSHAFTESCLLRQTASDQAIISLGRFSAIERLANLILSLRTRLAATSEMLPGAFKIPLRRDDFADALGLTPVHISRTFTRLKALGILEFKSGTITILDESALETLARGSA